jgi:16S rRNA (guanine527-N7)-methyltransferase
MTDNGLIDTYFPGLTDTQKAQIAQLKELYTFWNAQINVISRKDVDNFYLHHVLHSLGIAKVVSFIDGARVIDIGTGGGFPGIPLAILFPECEFHLVDSIGKKIKVVNEVASAIGLTNVNAYHSRSEDIKLKAPYVVSRAVTRLEPFIAFTRHLFDTPASKDPSAGLYYLKGGDLTEEIAETGRMAKIHWLSDWFSESFFETKAVVQLNPLSSR